MITAMSHFSIGFIGISTGIYMNVYCVTITTPLSPVDLDRMIHILRCQLLEPIQADYEDFRLYSTMYELKNMFGEAAIVSVSDSIIDTNMDMSIRILGCDSQDIIFRVWLDVDQQHEYVELREEGSHTLLTQLFQDGGIMQNI